GDRTSGLFPGQPRSAAIVVPVAADFLLQCVVPGTVAILRPDTGAVLVGRLVIGVIAEIRIGVGALAVLVTPVLAFPGRVDPLSQSLAGASSGKRSHHSAHKHTDGAEECAYTGTDGGATHPADTDADRMGAGCMGNGVAIHIVGIFHGVLVLGSAWVWERPFRGTLPGFPVIAPLQIRQLLFCGCYGCPFPPTLVSAVPQCPETGGKSFLLLI